MSEEPGSEREHVVTLNDEELDWLRAHCEEIMRGPDGRPGHASPVGFIVVGIARKLNNLG